MDPNEPYGNPSLIEKPADLPEGVKPPQGVVIGPGNGQYYAYVHTFADGHRVVQWFKRGSGDGTNDPVEFETPGPVAQAVKDKWDQRTQQQQNQARQGDQEGDTRGPQTGPTREVFRGGKWTVEPNPLYQATTRTPEQQASDAAVAQTNQQTAQTAQELNNERSYNLNHGGLYETHAERRAREQKEAQENTPKTSSQVVQRNGQAYIVATTTDKNGNIVKSQVLDTSGQPVQGGLPAEQTKPQPVSDGKGGWGYWDTSKSPPAWVALTGGPGGKPYSNIKYDEDARVWWGLTPDGKWERLEGGPGTQPQPTSAGPSLPVIMLGHSQEALRQFKAQLQEEVASGRHTQQWANDRWREATEVAQQTLNEAQLLQSQNATELNASVNLANSRLAASTSGFNSALDFVGRLNSTLKPGSTKGGEAFEALLNLQVLQAHRMGAYDNIVPGSQPSMFRPGSMPPVSGVPSTSTQPPGVSPPPPAAVPDAAAEPASPPLMTQSSLISSPPADQMPPPPTPSPSPPVRDDWNTNPGPSPVSEAAPPMNDWAVMAQAPGLSNTPAFSPTPTATPEPTYAMLHSQAASTPPWRLTEDQVNQMRMAGVPEEAIWSVPGRSSEVLV